MFLIGVTNIIWTPKYRYKILEGIVKEQLFKDIPMLLDRKSCELMEMNIQILQMKMLQAQ